MGYDVNVTRSKNTTSALDVQILLSRPYYRIGGKPVVGTILVRQPLHSYHQPLPQRKSQETPIRDRIESLQFTMIGLCRYDPRWFNASIIDKERHYQASQLRLPTDYELPPHTVPFWTSHSGDEPIDLIQVQERNFGQWDDVNPMKPIPLPSARRVKQKKTTVNDSSNEKNKSSNESNSNISMDENHQLAYTFRVNIPHNSPNALSEEIDTTPPFAKQQPHTFHGVSCRYYYLIVVRLQPKESAISTSSAEIQWITQVVTVVPEFHTDDTGLYSLNRPSMDVAASSSSSNLPSMQIMAHSNGVPTRLTALELNQWEGRYTVNRFGAAMYRNVSRGQSLTIVDPTSKCLVGVLTILGTPNHLRHGSRLTLKMDFPIRHQLPNEDVIAPVRFISCYQVSACLQGQEVAIVTSSSSSSSRTNQTKKRTTARRYVWDAANELVDPDTTNSVAMDLLVPETVPCSIQTPNVELNIQCIIDIAIGTSVRGSIEYRNIHLEIPCHVRPTVHDWERSNDDGEDLSSSQPLHGTVRQLYDTAKQLLRHEPPILESMNGTTENGSNAHSIDFETFDIQTDLKLLSVQMAKMCHLKPTPIS